MTIGRAFQFALLLIWAFGNIFLENVSFLVLLFTIPCGFAVITQSDMLNKDTIDEMKLLLWAALSTVAVMLGIFGRSESSVTEVTEPLFGSPVLSYVLPLRLSNLMFSTFINAFLFYYCLKIYRKAPSTMKRVARWIVIGPSVLFFGAFIFYLVANDALPWSFFVIRAIESTFAVWGFIREPRLAFVLPFHVHRLTVIETTGGISLFNHVWDPAGVIDEDLFSSSFQGVDLFTRKSLGKGGVREMELDNGVLIIRNVKNFPVACLLLTNKFSRTLRMVRDHFVTQFSARYSSFFNAYPKRSNFMTQRKL